MHPTLKVRIERDAACCCARLFTQVCTITRTQVFGLFQKMNRHTPYGADILEARDKHDTSIFLVIWARAVSRVTGVAARHELPALRES